ncbi:uncharacterized protein LOC131678032 [Topomyia yanbarensis]|uniref:uncharacterized protein LOC131678032 n=1 Tax=Topomyia yanbarensis TaxID=2498891 RepID=UPI00273CD9C5|nr:uncharacterized protein LOC131678032 [Topomyia yanbarensis]
MGIPDSQSDYNQWLHAMKMVARLPGGIPVEFRRKLWLALSDRFLRTKGINWEEEGNKYLNEQWDEDDDELGIQIVKDLHRTGSSLCSGPSGMINQAKLKRVLLGYSRFNPEIGYCQGFNMLGALILQVMDKSETDSIKVMILLIEGLLPPGYFCGSLGGLQADMAVFRDLLGTKLPQLAHHLQKLQGPEGAFEPPLTNVFTMQWFLTLFCTCLPIDSVLRIWDLILIEGSDILLRTALAIWGLLESRILLTKTADDFYCKMGALSTELVNGNLIDCNNLVQRIVDIGAIAELHRMRQKHLKSLTELKESSNLRLFYSDDEGESDEDSRLAVTATAWGFRSGRRASLGISTNIRNTGDGKEKSNLDISLLKKQYDKLKERQRQAHIILTAAVARHPNPSTQCSNSLQVNQLLVGKNALLSNKCKRLGPPQGAVPPVRVPKVSKQTKTSVPKTTDSLHWKDMDDKQCRGSLKWKEMQKDTKKPAVMDDYDATKLESPKLIQSSSASSAISNLSETPSSSIGAKLRSESSSYSEESDEDSSTSTSLCDDENQLFSASSLEASPMNRRLTPDSIKEVPDEERLVVIIDDVLSFDYNSEGQRNDFALSDITEESYTEAQSSSIEVKHNSIVTESKTIEKLPDITNNEMTKLLPSPTEDRSLSIAITSTSHLSPIPDIMRYVSMSTISPLKTPSSIINYADYNKTVSDIEEVHELPTTDAKIDIVFNVNEDGVTNQLFERINAAERPNKLDLNVIKERKVSESMVNITESILDRSDNTSKLNSYSLSNASNISSMSSTFGIPIRAHLQHDLPLAPPTADILTTTSEKSTIILKPHAYQIAEATTPLSKDSLEGIEKYLTSRIKFLKEKSFSMDDPFKGEGLYQEDISKRSASEGLVAVDLNAYKCNKMSEIIKENSLILDRIVKKAICFNDNHPEQSLGNIPERKSGVKSLQFNSWLTDDALLLNINSTRNFQPNQQAHENNARTFLKQFQTDQLTPKSPYKNTFDERTVKHLANESSKCTMELQVTEIQSLEAGNTSPISGNSKLVDKITKTDLVIKRTEEQLARFNDPHPISYIRKDNFCELVTLDDKKESIILNKADDSKQRSILEGMVILVPDKLLKEATIKHNAKTDTLIETTKSGPPSQTIENHELLETTSLEEICSLLTFPALDTRIMVSKTDELIKKTEEQLARFKNDNGNVLRRSSLIDSTFDEAITANETSKELERRSSSKTEEVIKKSEEQFLRIKIKSPFIAKKSPTRLMLEDLTRGDMKSVASSTKTEELIKKTDEQLAMFKAAAESNAEKRKSRHEINELLQLKAESSDSTKKSLESIKFDDVSIRIQEEAEIFKTVPILEEVRSFKTDDIIKRIGDGKLKLGDDYITTIKTIDYLKQSNANLSATLSSIESSIKAIDGLCDHDSDIQSNRINDTIDNLEKSLKQFDNINSDPPLVMVHDYSSTHESRCRPTTSNRPSRSRKRREYSPRRKKERDRDDRDDSNIQKTRSSELSDTQSMDRESPKIYPFHSYYSTSPPISPRVVSSTRKLLESKETIWHSSFKSTCHDQCLLQRDIQLIKYDKSPSSPLINKSYLESLKPATLVASGRTTRSAENSPPFHPQQIATFPSNSNNVVGIQGSLLRRHTAFEGEHSRIKSCENILMRFDYKNISAIAASYPISSTHSPSPTKLNSLDFSHDVALNFRLTSTPKENIELEM